MARSIAADATEAWRAVLVHKNEKGEIWYSYEGIYNTRGVAQGRVTYHKNRSYNPCYDGWVEKADIAWRKEKD